MTNSKMIFVLDRICLAFVVGVAVKVGYKIGVAVTELKHQTVEKAEQDHSETEKEKTEDSDDDNVTQFTPKET